MDAEDEIAAALYPYFARQFAEIRRQIEANRIELMAARQLNQVTKQVNISLNWGEEEQSLIAVLGDLLKKLFAKAQASVRQMLERMGVTVSWDVYDQAAADYAQNYTYGLIHDLTESTRRQLGQAISQWIETDEDFEELVKKVRTIVPPNPSPILRDRARLIAQTETTRVYAESRMAGFRAAGLTRMEWRTAEDELVCPICAPMAGQEGSVTGGVISPANGQAYTPPAHPGCRCWLVESVAELEAQVKT